MGVVVDEAPESLERIGKAAKEGQPPGEPELTLVVAEEAPVELDLIVESVKEAKLSVVAEELIE
ncbi:hypothetical protein BKA56DRAFT_596143 [Ilyonectria sp. MPI-CAGE-AT-0026]|nr:hypothetical protein BKA56DRAFT_596143 [Ilyonectria sp. MPI-CAGE-AT-0026]